VKYKYCNSTLFHERRKIMKRSAQLLLVVLAALMLAACAATTGTNIHPSDTALGHNEVIGAVSAGP
jgi:uncharacterized lipoprotein YajG